MVMHILNCIVENIRVKPLKPCDCSDLNCDQQRLPRKMARGPWTEVERDDFSHLANPGIAIQELLKR